MFAVCQILVFLIFQSVPETGEHNTHAFDVQADVTCRNCSCAMSSQCLVVDCFNRSLEDVPLFIPESTCVLNLTLNRIRSVYLNQFQRFPNLKVLDLSENVIDKIHGAPSKRLSNLQYLNLSSNNLSSLHEDTYTSLTGLVELNLSNCRLKTVAPRTFLPLQNIRTLDLSGNLDLGLVGLQKATNGLQNSNITRMIINKIIGRYQLCVNVTKEHLQYLQNTSLETIEANDNQIESFATNALTTLPKTLKYVRVRNNRFAYAHYVNKLHNLRSLTELDMGGHMSSLHDLIPIVPVTSEIYEDHPCDSNPLLTSTSLTVDMDELPFAFFSRFKTSMRFPLPVPPNLKRVIYTHAETSFVIPEIYFGPNNLEYIDMSYNVVAVWKGPILGLNTLKHLDISQNVAHNVSDDFFRNLSSLTFLNISGNTLVKCLSNDKDGKIFRNLYNLKVLDLSNQYVRSLPKNVFQGLTSLTHLDISYNGIYDLKLNLTHNKNLTFLDCSHNQISWINFYQRRQFDLLAKLQHGTFSVDFTGNHLHCHCDEIEFVKWISDSNVIFYNIEDYNCSTNNGTYLNMSNPRELLERLSVSCRKFNSFSLVLGVLALSLLVMCIIVGSVLYRYRWKLRYLFYAAKIRMKKSTEPSHAFDFDAFVSYADEDRSFVLSSLMPKLEGNGIRLNIHHRDFLPGNAIAENIIDAVQRSRRTVLILSRNFLKSKWCRYELHMANMESVSTGRDVLLVVMLEDIPTGVIPAEILYHIQTNTYIEYPQSENDDSMFWSHICQTLCQ